MSSEKNGIRSNAREGPRRGGGNDVIEIVDPNLRLGFAQVPRPVLKAQGISDKAKIVYALLLDYAWQSGSCFPGQQRLAEDLHTTERTIRRALDELRANKLVNWRQRGLNQTNIYYILDLSESPVIDLERPAAPERTFLSAPERTEMSAPEQPVVPDQSPDSRKDPGCSRCWFGSARAGASSPVCSPLARPGPCESSAPWYADPPPGAAGPGSSSPIARHSPRAGRRRSWPCRLFLAL